MRSLIVCAALVALTACNSQQPPTAQAQETAAAAPAKPVEPSMAPPDEAVFAQAYAAACTGAPAVSTSICKSAGFGKTGFVCDYGLGEEQHPHHNTTLVPEDGKWVLSEPEKTCAADAA
jgi:hypothetical protein